MKALKVTYRAVPESRKEAAEIIGGHLPNVGDIPHEAFEKPRCGRDVLNGLRTLALGPRHQGVP